MHVDSELVRACQRGEPGALDALIRATYADVYRLARRLVGDENDAAPQAGVAGKTVFHAWRMQDGATHSAMRCTGTAERLPHAMTHARARARGHRCRHAV